MYNLCKLDLGTHNRSVLGHPLNVIKRSEDLRELSKEMKKRILDGCPSKSFIVFKSVEFEPLCAIKWAGEKSSN